MSYILRQVALRLLEVPYDEMVNEIANAVSNNLCDTRRNIPLCSTKVIESDHFVADAIIDWAKKEVSAE